MAQHSWAFTFGVLGNVVSLMVYLAPLQTFYRVYKKKTTEGFQSVPYVVSLFSAMLWLYYALIKTDAPLLITINLFGCFIQTVYITIYLKYAPRKARIQTAKLLLLFNLGMFNLILLFTLLLWEGPSRVRVVGWVCVAFSISVFAAPLSIMKLVINTKSVEFMPFYLSFFLTLSAVMWFVHGFLLNDIYIFIPNVLGFILGFLQMVLYGIYNKNTKEVKEVEKLPEGIIEVIKVSAMGSAEVHPIDIQLNHDEYNIDDEDRKVDEQTHNNEKSIGVPTDIQLSEFEV